MIPAPVGWAVEYLPDALTFTHPRGRVAQLFYRERAGRPRRMGTLAREILAGWPRLTLHSFGAIERITSLEGELAALVTATCEQAGQPVFVVFGFIFTDDFVTSLTAIGREEQLRSELVSLVRDTLRRDNLALGIRRRRFDYQPPVGWQPIVRGLATEWIPPDFPAHDARLVVYPANPIPICGRATFTDLHRFFEQEGWTVTSVGEIEVRRTPHGLQVESQIIVASLTHGPIRSVRFVVATDVSYQYIVELRRIGTSDPTDDITLHTLVDSIPSLGPSTTSAAMLALWSE